jgi:hypothetical protein
MDYGTVIPRSYDLIAEWEVKSKRNFCLVPSPGLFAKTLSDGYSNLLVSISTALRVEGPLKSA